MDKAGSIVAGVEEVCALGEGLETRVGKLGGEELLGALKLRLRSLSLIQG